MCENAIEVRDVSMCFNLSREKVDSLKEYFVKFLKRELMYDEFYAVKNVSFEIKKGECFGIVGRNGSGKSTLLKMVSGIYRPTVGSVSVKGSIAPLIELGAGFDVDLTAKENILLNGAVLGHSKKFMMEKCDEILDFSELHEFVNVPIKNYSSGMVARLGFSIATLVKPEILIVDEILSVGDYEFQQKCEAKMDELMNGGTTLMFVSHSMEQVRKICDRVLWMEKGLPMMLGSVDEVCDKYLHHS